MTEEIIKAITEAEAQGAKIRSDAMEKAAQIVAAAEAQAAREEKTSAEVCKAYADTQIKVAKADADKSYAETVDSEERKARAYCAEALKNADDEVSEIVGRIIRGDC